MLDRLKKIVVVKVATTHYASRRCKKGIVAVTGSVSEGYRKGHDELEEDVKRSRPLVTEGVGGWHLLPPVRDGNCESQRCLKDTSGYSTRQCFVLTRRFVA